MTKQDLVENLNSDLAAELGAIIQYITYAAKVSGANRPQLSAFFEAEIADEHRHAQFLSNKIVSLGGNPTTVPTEVQPAASNQEMLGAVLEAERLAVAHYTERAQQAEALGEKGLAINLEDMIKDESRHAEECARVLSVWSE